MKQENKIEELEGDLSEANQEIGSLKYQLQQYKDRFKDVNTLIESKSKKIGDIFKMFDEYSCIKDDDWYKQLKQKYIKENETRKV